MKKVGIAGLKARLSEPLRTLRRGQTLTALDRETPVARIVTDVEAPLEVRRATRKLPPAKPTGSVAELLEDRARR